MSNEIEQKYIDLVNKYIASPDPIIADAIFLNGRKLIERIMATVFGKGKNKTKELRAKLGYKTVLWWGMINNYNHDDEIFNNMPAETFIKKVADLAKEIDNTINLPTIHFLTEEILLKFKVNRFSNYVGIVKGIGNDDIGNFVKIIYSKKGYGQKNVYTMYYHDDIEFSVGQIYKLDADLSSVHVSGQDTGFVVLKISKAEIMEINNLYLSKHNKEFLELLNKNIRENKTSMLDEIIKSKVFGDSNIVSKLRKIFKKFSYDETMGLIMPLKYSHSEPIVANLGKSPINYEFWTKNPRIAPLSFYDKKIISWFLDDKISSKFKFEKNREAELKYKDTYTWPLRGDILDQFPDNNKFNTRYQNSKIVKYKKMFTNVNKFRLMTLFDYWEKKNIKYDVNPTVDISKLDKYQKLTFLNVMNNKFSLINGAAGSGKTRLASKLMEEFNKTENYLFLALTHKANSVVREMKTSLNIKTQTIASFINSYNSYEDYNIIIDEVSMIGDDDWLKIEEKVSNVKRLILMGDCYQLPPLYSSSYIQFLFESKPEKFNELMGNHRQVDKVDRDWITRVRAAQVENGSERYFLLFDKYADFTRHIKQLSGKFNFISPVHGGLYGTLAITAITTGANQNDFCVGDIIILNQTITGASAFLHNDRKFTINKIVGKKLYFQGTVSQKNLFNGIKDGFSCIVDGVLCYDIDYKKSTDEEGDIRHPFVKANAVSVHSMQGSTEKNVCFVIPPGRKIDMKMFYTAVTRFKEKLLILSNTNEIHKIIK